VGARSFYRLGDAEIVGLPVDGREGFRIVRSARPHSRHFWSDSDAGKQPGRGPTLLYLGLSVFLTPDVARERAQRWPVLGAWIARMDLASERGFWFAHTFSDDHITLWGLPDDLAAAVIAVEGV
jgi:hypothetical protein